MATGRAGKTIVKRVTKRCLAVAGRFLPRHALCSRILTYHSIGFRRHDMNVTPAVFRVQMEWLAHNAAVISLDEAAAGRPGVALTFDDGFADFQEYAAPVLEDLGLPAVIFLVAGRMEGLMDDELDAENGRLLSWEVVRALEARGFEFGAHTLNHRRLAGLSEEEQRLEIAGCQTLIRERLGHPATAFAYPYGSVLDYNDASIRLAREAGFRYALTNRYGFNRPGDNLWTLRRIWIDASDTLKTFQEKIVGRLDMLRLLDSRTGARMRRAFNSLVEH